MHDPRPPLWSGLSDEEHEFQYNPQRAFPNFADHQAERAPANTSARTNLKSHLDVPYGEYPLRRVDVFPADGAARTPVHVFFHGGYWRAQDKENFTFVARELVARGVTTVIANYELCPASTLDGVVDSALTAIEWICRHIADYGGDPNRISLSGHSAGAHLCAEVLATDWLARGISPACVLGAVMISGIFDPEPTIRTTVNAQLNLDPEIAARHNVEVRPPLVDCPTWIFAGGREPWQWLDQSYRYAHHLHRHGRDPEVHVLPGWNHFDIVAQYMQEDSPILRATLASAFGRQGR
jgi:arylformamidase